MMKERDKVEEIKKRQTKEENKEKKKVKLNEVKRMNGE